MFDNVRVRVTPATVDAGVAGLEGQVYGLTTPSVTNVEVIGEHDADEAVNVYFEERGESLWFVPDLLEFINHAPGTEIRLDGIDKRWTRAPEGRWLEESIVEKTSKPWWKFWE